MTARPEVGRAGLDAGPPERAEQTLAQALEGRRFGVVLSAGFFGFYGHAGFVEALAESGLQPCAWAGTSAGGLVGALAAAGLTPVEIRQLILSQRRDDFWDPDPLGIAVDLVRKGSRTSGLLKGDRFRGLLERHLPVRRFEQLRAPLVVVASNVSSQQPEVITEGDLPSAIHATCAYPGLFQVVRRGGALLWDGGIVDKAPALALADSAHGRGLQALLVHFLPSRDGAGEPVGPFAWPSGMAAGMAALRKDHFRLQLQLLRARGIAVHVVTSRLPPVGPTTMERGVDALEAAKRSLAEALAAPPQGWLGSD